MLRAASSLQQFGEVQHVGDAALGVGKTQEVFHCQECDFELNADLNAALNILNRLALDVLRHGLLMETEFGFKPKVVSKEVIRKTIEDAYSKSMVVAALKKAA